MPAERRSAFVLLVLAMVALGLSLLFMTVGVRGGWAFVLPFRGAKLGALLVVGTAIAVATVLFHTISGNRILTPAIMGFDALFVLLQTAGVFAFGAGGLGIADPRLLFAIELLAMVLFATLLYGALLRDHRGSLHLLLLVGIVFGVLFRSASLLMQRLIDPSDFAVLQVRLFANVNAVSGELLVVAAPVVAAGALAAWRLTPRLDVLLLGRDGAIGLGIDHRTTQLAVLSIAAILVSASTALVGPITFLGLLVASLAYRLVPSFRHALLLPAAALIAISTLLGGQMLLERVFGLEGALGTVIEVVGGIVFLLLLLRGAR